MDGNTQVLLVAACALVLAVVGCVLGLAIQPYAVVDGESPAPSPPTLSTTVRRSPPGIPLKAMSSATPSRMASRTQDDSVQLLGPSSHTRSRRTLG